MNQQHTPFLDSLVRAKNAHEYSFHMPGHKFIAELNPQITDFMGETAFEADLNEISPGVDYLHASKGSLLEAQRLAAEAVGADRSYFLINGSTVGNQASMLAAVHDGQTVIVPRAAHRSVYAGLILSGANPIYVPPVYHPQVEFPLAVPLEIVRDLLAANPDARAIQITSPNYYGYLSDVGGMANLAHEHNIPLLVDEAHGAHLPFHPDLPPSGVQVGADLVVQSSHKTVGALTQAALLHLNGSRIVAAHLEQILSMMQSSSPSVLLTASLDAARQQMATQGYELLTTTIQLAAYARQSIRKISGLWCYGDELVGETGIFAHDPTKLVIRVVDSSMNGHVFAEHLAQEYNLYGEFVDPKHIICSITIADNEQRIDYLLNALRAVAAKGKLTATSSVNQHLKAPHVPEMVINPRQANFAVSKRIPLAQAVGEICAEQIMPYPPGIPLLLPGERIDSDMLDYLHYIKAQGIKIVGPEDTSLEFVRVIDKSA
ncbi:MAG: aminotransferase class I/II-fold pyridoxal phosphate-dependent enzyme [Anaerolineaceae bacterium]|nr:aminotransferase class I/II-fold pyridoxal phosphate-dependent enzyme [Anaerolineaceae bacterium]